LERARETRVTNVTWLKALFVDHDKRGDVAAKSVV
jgi:hypothetical protein